MFFLIMAFYFGIKMIYFGFFSDSPTADIQYDIYFVAGILMLGIYDITERLQGRR